MVGRRYCPRSVRRSRRSALDRGGTGRPDFQRAISVELDRRRQQPDGFAQRASSRVLRRRPTVTRRLATRSLSGWSRELLVAGNETTTRTIAEIDPQPGRRSAAVGSHPPGTGLRSQGDRGGTAAVEPGDQDVPKGHPGHRAWRSAAAAGNERVSWCMARPTETSSCILIRMSCAPDRPNLRDHVAFGHGIHVCVGAGLARMEARALLRSMAEQLDDIRVVDKAELRYLPSYFLHGLRTFPLPYSDDTSAAAIRHPPVVKPPGVRDAKVPQPHGDRTRPPGLASPRPPPRSARLQGRRPQEPTRRRRLVDADSVVGDLRSCGCTDQHSAPRECLHTATPTAIVPHEALKPSSQGG